MIAAFDCHEDAEALDALLERLEALEGALSSLEQITPAALDACASEHEALATAADAILAAESKLHEARDILLSLGGEE